MAIPLQVTSLDEVGDEFKGAYDETESGFVLDPERYAEAKAAGLKKKNQELLGKLQTAQSAAKKFEGVKDDVWSAFQEWQAKQQEEGEGEAATTPRGTQSQSADGKSVNVEELQAKWQQNHDRELKKLKDAHAAALKEREAELARVQADHQAFVKQKTLTDWALSNSVKKDRLSTWLKVSDEYFQWSEDGKTLVPMDEDGMPSDLKPERFVNEFLRSKFDYLYDAPEQHGGSGSTTGTRTAGGGGNFKRGKMTHQEKAEYIRRHGAEAYNKLPM